MSGPRPRTRAQGGLAPDKGDPELTASLGTDLKLEGGAPNEMIMSTDATWGNVNYSPIYALALTMYGGVVASHEKLIHLLVD